MDFGNRQSLHAATSSQDIKPLAPIFIEEMPPYAYRCSLVPVTDAAGQWSPKETAEFQDAILEKEFVAAFRPLPSLSAAGGSATYVVTLKEGETVVGEELAKRYAVPAPIVTSETSLTSPSSLAESRPNGMDQSASPYSRISIPPSGDKLGEHYHPVSVL